MTALATTLLDNDDALVYERRFPIEAARKFSPNIADAIEYTTWNAANGQPIVWELLDRLAAGVLVSELDASSHDAAGYRYLRYAVRDVCGFHDFTGTCIGDPNRWPERSPPWPWPTYTELTQRAYHDAQYGPILRLVSWLPSGDRMRRYFNAIVPVHGNKLVVFTEMIEGLYVGPQLVTNFGPGNVVQIEPLGAAQKRDVDAAPETGQRPSKTVSAGRKTRITKALSHMAGVTGNVADLLQIADAAL